MFDLVIIGAGPAGLGASVYAKRAGLKALLIEENPVDGGQVLSTYEVDNYLGLPKNSGIELSDKFSEHAKLLGVERKETQVNEIKKIEEEFILSTDEGEIKAKAVILATGAGHAHLNVPGEEELQGMGVSYCATCDGAFFKNKEVCVVGGSDVAVEDAIYLSRTSKKVYLIHRRDSLRAADSLIKAMEAIPNISIIWDTEVEKINGEDMVESVSLINKKTMERSLLKVQGIFVAVGIIPHTRLIENLIKLDDKGYCIAKEDTRTALKGLYAAGDVRKKPLRQIITAVCDGANAVNSFLEDYC